MHDNFPSIYKKISQLTFMRHQLIKGSTCENQPRKCVSPLDIVKAQTGVFEPSRPHYRHKRHPLFAGLFSALCNQIHTHRAAHHFCGRHWGSVICFSLREKRILARERKSLHFSVALTPPSLHTNRGKKRQDGSRRCDPPVLVLYRLGYVLTTFLVFLFHRTRCIFLIYYSQLGVSIF